MAADRTSIVLERLDTKDLPAVCRFELEARKENPLSQAMLPNWADTEEKRLKYLIRKAEYDLSYGSPDSHTIKAVSLDSGRILGIMSWSAPLPSGTPPAPPLSPEEQAKKDKAREYLINGVDPVLRRSMGEEGSKAEREVPSPHMSLDNMVVAKEAQGQGVGTFLLNSLLDRANSAGLPIFCFSSAEGYYLYTKGGFRVMRWVDFKTSSGSIICERAMFRPVDNAPPR